jgi:hypothetical protein
MLAVITLLAVVFLVVSRAVQGSGWAIGVSAAVLTFAVLMLVHVGLFSLIWLVSLLRTQRQRPAAPIAAVGSTPFGTQQTGPDHPSAAQG